MDAIHTYIEYNLHAILSEVDHCVDPYEPKSFLYALEIQLKMNDYLTEYHQHLLTRS